MMPSNKSDDSSPADLEFSKSTLPLSTYVSPGEKYRLSAQANLRQNEGLNALDAIGPAGWGVEHAKEATGKHTKTRSAVNRFIRKSTLSPVEIVLIFLSIGAFVGLILLMGEGNSVISQAQLALVALIPLAAVTAILSWIDRKTPIVWRYKLLALAWGAGIAAGAAIIVNSALYQDFLLSTGDLQKTSFLSSVLVAPFSEELFKGIGALVILVGIRNRVTSNLSGAALGGLVGAGFAYIENIQYFLQAMQEGGAVLGMTILARGVMSPFVHPMATSLTGLAISSALLSRTNWWGWCWRLTLGFGAAVSVHALWNGLASLGVQWILWYILIEVPLFTTWLVWLIIASNRQVYKIQDGLAAYVAAGWISVPEVAMVCNPQGRKYAKKWSRNIGKPARKMVRQFMHDLGRLGLDQMLMTKYGYQESRTNLDRHSLQNIQSLRFEFSELETLHKQPKQFGYKGTQKVK